MKIAQLYREQLEREVPDPLLTKPWHPLVGGRLVDATPRYAMSGQGLSHFAHHSGQLTVYLRLNGRKVPSIYGPTADGRW